MGNFPSSVMFVRPWLWTWNESEKFIGHLSYENLVNCPLKSPHFCTWFWNPGVPEVPLESNPDMLNDFAWKVRCITKLSHLIFGNVSNQFKSICITKSGRYCPCESIGKLVD